MKKAIVTGAAGFIGSYMAENLLQSGWQVIGLDNLNSYYDVGLKEDRLKRLALHEEFRFAKVDIADMAALESVIAADYDADIIIHLAAQAGVRYSIENPSAYVSANVQGQVSIFETALKMAKRPPVVYASSSSVYGANKKIPFSEDDAVNAPVSVYAATKRAGELLAYSYQHVHQLTTVGLRFFTVYGPWGRPDMAPWLFTDAILAGRAIKVFNHGDMQRDFTYIDDIIAGVRGVVNRVLEDPAQIRPIYNLGNNRPVRLGDFIHAIEKATGQSAIQEMLPMPPADVPLTYADIDKAVHDLNYHPQTTIDDGIARFVSWFKDYRLAKHG